MPKLVYHVTGLGNRFGGMGAVSVTCYEFARETPKRIYVYQRAGERYFDKQSDSLFWSVEDVQAYLKAEKERRLKAAERLVETLKEPHSFNVHTVPRHDPGYTEDILL